MQHVIIGAGPAGVIAAETLRKRQPDASVIIVGDEPEPPYSRMALPYYLTGDIAEAGTHLRKTEGYFHSANIEIRQDRVTGIDAGDQSLNLASGGTLSYDRALIATGSQPMAPPVPGVNLPGVSTCWTLADGRAIANSAKAGSNVVLMGAGFIGCIILESLVKRGVNLTVVEMENRMVPRMMNDAAGSMIKSWCESKGVSVHTSTKVSSIESAAGGLSVLLDNGQSVAADLVIQATGVKPNVGFLDGSGVELGFGVKVDTQLSSSNPNIFAAGDVAEGRDFSTGGYSVQAIQPTAADHGRIAALNMAGAGITHQGSVNMNVLDTIGLISCSFGLWDGADGGDSVTLEDAGRYRYINLQFQEDVIVGASTLGWTDHVGVIRGLIQSRVRLGRWAGLLRNDPTRLLEAYVANTQALGGNAYAFAQSALAH